jgi:putative endonuclease
VGGWAYILASHRNGTLYVGVTNDLARRAHEHRERASKGFTSRYGVTKLVWCEEHARIEEAIHREKRIKHWTRAMKLELIERDNPSWMDLYETLNW